MDLDAVRTFVAVADTGQFQEAAAALSLTQQAVSKRIATLEKDLAVRLFTRTARGARLTIDGQAFLPHARELLRVAERADASVRPGRRALRIDVVNRRIATAVLLQDFYRTRPDLELDVVTLDTDVEGAIAAVEAGTIDATFHGVPPHRQLPEAIAAAPAVEEPHELLVGPRHPLAGARSVTPERLAGHRIWMPGLAARGEVADYYAEFAAVFGVTIDMLGPVFGNEALLDEIADSADLATLVGANSRYMWPDSYDLRRIPIRDPSPIYPLSMIRRVDNPHPALAELREFVAARRSGTARTAVWLPSWTHRAN
ncbi:LysR family transcriptional regulator [Nocardia aurantia]|uniref:HTH-type transcriptional regulator HdfR n=1 Tax=Nocardia aurantia TaxID=2585199 RepID=A0A7K0DYD8_9NOCA|nr:LysR family transcriptional regulator [Nocardia aurantia]MQY30558.1 HTH-type transcriptional regulator HdfR [Nocardia aurantia]